MDYNGEFQAIRTGGHLAIKKKFKRMPLIIISSVAAQKGMNWNEVEIREAKIMFNVTAFWRVSSMRTINNQLINTVIFG